MSKKTLIAAAVGTAFAATFAAPLVSAAENPFALSSMDKGYMVAEHNDGHTKMMKDGKCGEGKCGEGKCGAKKTAEGKCGMSMADTNKDGKVSKEEAAAMHASMFEKTDANKDGFIDKDEMAKMKDGKCGGAKAKTMEGKCGGAK